MQLDEFQLDEFEGEWGWGAGWEFYFWMKGGGEVVEVCVRVCVHELVSAVMHL